jgi:hypothetical protein
VTAEPGAIELLAEPARQARRHHHERHGGEREEPRPRPIARQHVEERQHHDVEPAEGEQRRQQHRAALHEQVVELEAVLVVGRGREEEQRRDAHELAEHAEGERRL